MESLIDYYNYQVQESNEFKAFKLFYGGNIEPITAWLENKYSKKLYIKDNLQSQDIRNKGNNCYKSKMFEESIKLYTKALNLAEWNSKEYGLALANRSAALYCLDNYKNCIRDIDYCMQTKYPIDLLYKIYIRKAECHEKLDMLTTDYVQDTISIINDNMNITKAEKEKHLKKLKSLKICFQKSSQPTDCKAETKFYENKNFAFASDTIGLYFDNQRGRHVRARKDIFQGETLFVEKAFTFAPVFTESQELIPNKCFNCLSDMVSSIPCKACSMCEYCDEKCRDESWIQFHKWECKGMNVNLWSDLGIAFPAFRTLIQGVNSKFEMPNECDISEIGKFGDKNDNYPYFNRLLTNLDKCDDIIQFLVMSTVIVLYLKNKTDFFVHIKNQINSSTGEAIEKCGGLLVRHMAQLSCNSSIAEHWVSYGEEIPLECVQVACGIYPSVSMMNHSCKANISMYYKKDTVIVKALQDIKSNEEIFNCYGVDYRYTNFENRQYVLQRLYCFTCKCHICSNPLLEFNVFDSYLCQNCQGPVNDLTGVCYDCKKVTSLEILNQLGKEADNHIAGNSMKIKDIDMCSNIRLKLYTKYHTKILECYDLYYSIYKQKGFLLEMLTYFEKSLLVKKYRMGFNSRSIAIAIAQVVIYVVEQVKNGKSNIEEEKVKEKIKALYTSGIQILMLYYPKEKIKLGNLDEFVNKYCSE